MEELDFICSSCVCNADADNPNDLALQDDDNKVVKVDQMRKDFDDCCSCVYDRLTYMWRKKTFNHWKQVVRGTNLADVEQRDRARSRASSTSRSRCGSFMETIGDGVSSSRNVLLDITPALHIVVRYLNVDDIYRLMTTNKSICREVGRATHVLSFISARRVILDEHLATLSMQFPNLKDVNLTGCSNLTDESVEQLAEISKLSSIALKGCYQS
ncbi:F-box/LRR-repeat protein 13 [Phytophthora cinnamomi]|uniref:F-box/LRR-repeat protein 13 n=1 Tax=Phytophthora cinnamomi TaxID=4785 RepID=UPI003559AE2F|nr:F-box/LRR-repeat protein 13 [Phytophthora cinnamomi]